MNAKVFKNALLEMDYDEETVEMANAAVETLGDDLDGAWAMLDDYGSRVEFDDLLEAYKAATEGN